MKWCLTKYGLTAVFSIAVATSISLRATPQNAPPETAAAPGCVGCAIDGRTTPRSADGHPDLNGFWGGGGGNQNPDNFIRSDDGDVYYNITPAFQGKLEPGQLRDQIPNQPPYKPEYMAKVKAIASRQYGGTTAEDPMFDCKPSGIPRGATGTMQIVQTPQILAFLYEGPPGPNYRIVYTDGRPHPKDADTSYSGDSVGHWEGDTMVVDVTLLNDETWLGGGGQGNQMYTSIHSDKEHVIERWTRNGNTLTYEATVEDPVMFTRPWVITPRRLQLGAPGDQLIEAPCSVKDRDHLIKPTKDDQFLCDYCVVKKPAAAVAKKADTATTKKPDSTATKKTSTSNN